MKHIKSIEISSFEQFAPHYFEHVNKALEEKVGFNSAPWRINCWKQAPLTGFTCLG